MVHKFNADFFIIRSKKFEGVMVMYLPGYCHTF